MRRGWGWGRAGMGVWGAGGGGWVPFTASASGCPHASPLYQFFTLAPGAGSWTIAQAFSTTSTFSWSTSGKAPGAWQVAVWVRDASRRGVASYTFAAWTRNNSVTQSI